MATRWDRDRMDYEAARAERGRFEDRYQMRGGNGRDHSDERYDRRYHRGYNDDVVRDRRYYGEEPPYAPRREQPPPRPDYDRRPPVMERDPERRDPERDYPSRRPAFLRRQSSLDTFDRHPLRFYDREEYPPPARREDIHRDSHYRAPPYTDIPLPKTRSKALPPPRRYNDQYYNDIKIAEPDYFGDEDFRPYPDQRVHEREMVRHHKRRDSFGSSSRSTRTRTRRGSSPSSATSSRSSSSSGGTTIKSEYPKKGKTRIPARLVSKRALIDLGYPFLEEGNTVIVQKALGQANIDELLKLSEDYKKSEMEVAAARSLAGDLAEERKAEKAAEKAALPAPPPAPTGPPAPAPGPTPAPAAAPAPAPAPGPVYAPAPVPAPGPAYAPAPGPPQAAAPPPAATRAPPPAPAPPKAAAPGPAVVQAPAPVIIDASPHRSRSTSTSSSGSSHHHHHAGPVTIIDRSRSRSKSRSNRELRAEIRALERELVHRPRDTGPIRGREVVHAERLPDGQLVVYEEEVEKVIHHHKPPRIEKDKKGRLSLSVPLRR